MPSFHSRIRLSNNPLPMWRGTFSVITFAFVVCSALISLTTYGEKSQFCRETNVNDFNGLIYQHLQGLLKTRYFRYVKIDLSIPCEVTRNGSRCGEPPLPPCDKDLLSSDGLCKVDKFGTAFTGCEVKPMSPPPCSEELSRDLSQSQTTPSARPTASPLSRSISHGSRDFDMPPLRPSFDEFFDTDTPSESEDIAEVRFPEFLSGVGYFHAAERELRDFCRHDNSKGVIVDLVLNPERHTGYEGAHPHLAWRILYGSPGTKLYEGLDHITLDENAPGAKMMTAADTEPDFAPNVPQHQRLFHRVLSGLHSSISAHVSAEYYCFNCQSWVVRPDIFYERVGSHPRRVENLYLVYSLLLKALRHATPYLLKYEMTTTDEEEKSLIDAFLRTILTQIERCPMCDDLNISLTPELGETFNKYFDRIYSVTHCLGCQKCRLWSKVQACGIGVALKILSTPLDEDHNLRLSRSEVVCLFNVLGRISESLMLTMYFISMGPKHKYHRYTNNYPDVENTAYASLNILLGSNYNGKEFNSIENDDPRYHQHASASSQCDRSNNNNDLEGI